VNRGARRTLHQSLMKSLFDVLRTVYDPEMPDNIHDLGLMTPMSIHSPARYISE
jgi:metal-sulfur cluster biosynthetic enzyme